MIHKLLVFTWLVGIGLAPLQLPFLEKEWLPSFLAAKSTLPSTGSQRVSPSSHPPLKLSEAMQREVLKKVVDINQVGLLVHSTDFVNADSILFNGLLPGERIGVEKGGFSQFPEYVSFSMVGKHGGVLVTWAGLELRLIITTKFYIAFLVSPEFVEENSSQFVAVGEYFHNPSGTHLVNPDGSIPYNLHKEKAFTVYGGTPAYDEVWGMMDKKEESGIPVTGVVVNVKSKRGQEVLNALIHRMSQLLPHHSEKLVPIYELYGNLLWPTQEESIAESWHASNAVSTSL